MRHLALLVVLLGLAGCRRAPAPEPVPELPVLAAIPDFALVDQAGKPVTLADLRGVPWVGVTFFTSCRTICPGLLKAQGALQSRLLAEHRRGRLVSLTVDPENDDVARLQQVALRLHADPARWSFLTGDYAVIRRVVVEGFLSAIGDKRAKVAMNDVDVDVTHSGKLIVVDAAGNARFFAEPTTEGITQVLDALRRLETEPRR